MGWRMRKYLATASLYRYHPAILHGVVEIGDDGLVNGETPIEDFGMWYLSDNPITSEEAWDVWLGGMLTPTGVSEQPNGENK